MQEWVGKIWDALPLPNGLPNIDLPDARDIAFFEYKEQIVQGRKNKIQVVRDACKEVLAEDKISVEKVISTRYTQGLPKVGPNNLKNLVVWLDDYLQAIK